MARPNKYNVSEMIDIIEEYIKKTELPIFKEVCYINNWCDKYVYELAKKNDELSYSIKKLAMKKEVQLERGGLSGKYTPSMVIFSLKQLGWKEKQEENEENKVSEALDKVTNAIKKIRE